MHLRLIHATCSAHLIFLFFYHYNNNIQSSVQIISSLCSSVLPTSKCNMITKGVPNSPGLRSVVLNLFHGTAHVILWKTGYGNYCYKNEEQNLKITLNHMSTHFLKHKERWFVLVLYGAVSSNFHRKCKSDRTKPCRKQRCVHLGKRCSLKYSSLHSSV